MEDAISFDLDGIGNVTMTGVGPWRRSGSDIRDSNGVVANPTVVQSFSTTTKPNRNVVFARRTTTDKIVEKANELFSAAAPAETSTEVDG